MNVSVAILMDIISCQFIFSLSDYPERVLNEITVDRFFSYRKYKYIAGNLLSRDSVRFYVFLHHRKQKCY